MAGEFIGLKEKPPPTVLLNRHGQTTFKYSSLYPLLSVALRLYQKRFFSVGSS